MAVKVILVFLLQWKR